jgi:hypothetical protein
LGAEQQDSFEKIKNYLSSPPVLKTPKRGVPFRLYVAAEDRIIGAVLTQKTEGKEYIITYLSRRLIYAETRYTFIEKLCLSLYYACTKLRHYLLSSTSDFIVEHRINDEHDWEVRYITCTPWKLYFDGSDFELSNRLEEFCTNNQVEYEALLFGLEFLQSMCVKHVKAFSDSLLVV